MELTPVHEPDVIFLVYETYSKQEVLNYYCYDIMEQIDYLLNQSFAIYEGTYIIAEDYVPSLTKVFDQIRRIILTNL